MSEEIGLTSTLDAQGIARITLARPEVHNAFDDALIAALTRTLTQFGTDPAVRAVVLTGEGRSFSAGADLNWMRRMADYGEAENLADAAALARLMAVLNALPKPTLALVNGPAYGGGVGLVACCDIAIAAESASFCLSEVKLGLIPAVISPYVVSAIGARAARRYFLTAEAFPAEAAHRLGLVHEVVPPENLAEAGAKILAALRLGGPEAQAEAKDLIAAVDRPFSPEIAAETGRRIARRRASAEGREGLDAFLGKRRPSWVVVE